MSPAKDKQSVVNIVMKRLKNKDKPERSKRTLVLSKAAYEKFEQLCRKEGRYPSDVIDEFILLFVKELG